jgi:hypothetical protein
MTERTTMPTAEEILERSGFDEYGRSLNAPKSEYFEGDETQDHAHFWRQQQAALDDDDREVRHDSVDDITQAAKRSEILAATYLAQGKHVRAEEYKRGRARASRTRRDDRPAFLQNTRHFLRRVRARCQRGALEHGASAPYRRRQIG